MKLKTKWGVSSYFSKVYLEFFNDWLIDPKSNGLLKLVLKLVSVLSGDHSCNWIHVIGYTLYFVDQ